MSCSDDLTTVDLQARVSTEVMNKVSAGSERDENLWGVVDHANVTGLNLDRPDSAAGILKTWDDRHDMETFCDSGVDDQMIIHIPFIHSVRLRTLLLLPPSPSTPTRPSSIKIYLNLPSCPSFGDCEGMTPVMELNTGVSPSSWAAIADGGEAGDMSGRGLGGRREVEEWPLKVQKMASVWSVTLMISDSEGGERSRLYYAGFKGESRQGRRGETTGTVVPAANAAEAAVKPLAESNAVAGPSTLPTSPDQEGCPPPLETNAEPSAGDPPLTKSAAKKLARRAHQESTKLARRASERDRRKANAAKLKIDIAQGNLTPEELAVAEEQRARKALSRKLHQSRNRNGGTLVALSGPRSFKCGLVIDLEFDDLMTPAEIQSMSTQLGYVYNSNRRSERPFREIVMTGFGESTNLRKRMEGDLRGQHKSWTGMRFLDQDVEQCLESVSSNLVEGAVSPTKSITEPTAAADPSAVSDSTAAADDPTPAALISPPPPVHPSPEYPLPSNFIYLSADSPHEITELSEGETYVIGGIVDRNRYKNLCQNKADKMGMRTARLPIGTYLASLPTRKVLTVNQVFDILLKYNELGSWASALQEVIPLRKFADGKKSKVQRPSHGADGTVGEGGAEDEDDVEAEDGMQGIEENDEEDAEDHEAAAEETRQGGPGGVDLEAEAEELMNG